jgi:ectoine hydroxylase-related dioxygenase (phytanoyl-CoA dioxygenase family)
MEGVLENQLDLAEQLQTFEEKGYAVIENALSETELKTLRSAFDEVIAREKEIGTKRGWQQNVYVATYNMPQKHPSFLPLLEHPVLTTWMTSILGPNFVVSNYNAHGMSPGGTEQGLHIDQDESTPGIALFAQGLFTLDDFTIENGCTRVVPGSHKRRWPGSDYENQRAQIEAQTVRIEGAAGSFISWHGGLWHAGSANRTTLPRRCITLFCCRPWIRAHCDYMRSLSPDVIATLNETQKRRLGFFARAGWYNYLSDELFR